MISICAIAGGQVKADVPLEEVNLLQETTWYWVDLQEATTEEWQRVLQEKFRFDETAVQACLVEGERPQLRIFDSYYLIVANAISEEDLAPKEVNIFINKNYLVTFHQTKNPAVERVMRSLRQNPNEDMAKGPLYTLYYIFDQIVDQYFPPLYRIEDRLNEMDDDISVEGAKNSLTELFQIRSDLARIRRFLVPMRDLLYRIIHSHRFERFEDEELHREKRFTEIYEHLVKLVEEVESSRNLVSDIRDSYMSISSDFANDIMKKLTIVSTIFMPLTFIVGVYGMNFRYMPEIGWRFGYFIIMGIMAGISFFMYRWFRKKGWFDKK
ncbi:magnesium/cobalt transporter CorA [Ectobacillus ponti]|uniref:Magnesium transport protein CorA n=1 Tax=Ectobacillus ponti TaxID=2961894 RepID=A0AA41XCE9_9BACI|nr:magnesium/cobalt transporter CorA [Ectobacillus ponti]MCP8970865.1 magnesium/cobalt transporter CorA [Ectobacillus ponti]